MGATIVKELKKSRIGSTVGGAAVQLPREFYVELETPGEDAIKALREHRPDGVPEGASHPWDRNARARTFTIDDNIGPLGHIISVGYEYPATQVGLAIVGNWIQRFRSAEIPRRLEQELPWFDEDNMLRFEPRLIGPNKYVEIDPNADSPPTKTHTANVRGKTVDLHQLSERESVGADLPFPAATMILEREQGAFIVANIGQIIGYKHKVNDRDFFGAPPGHLEFMDWSVDPIPSPFIPGDTTGGAININTQVRRRISLTFLFSSVRLDVLPLLHTFKGKDGGLSFIHPSNLENIPALRERANAVGDIFLVGNVDSQVKLGENFRIRNSANFGSLLGLF